jgi:dynein heavy chain
MYQYSLQFYQSYFKLRLEKSEKNDELEKRLEILIDDITINSYINICRGLFEKDKMIYAFMIAVQIQRHAGAITPAMWKSYMLGAGPCDMSTLPDAPKPSKTTDYLQSGAPVIWEEVWAMESANPELKGLSADVAKKPGLWKKALIDAEFPHEEHLPAPWEKKLDNFSRLLVLRAFRPEKTVFGTRVFTGRELGQVFTESPPFDLYGSYDDSNCQTPLIFVLSPGADINEYLLKLAADKEKDDGLKIISLGQGQGPIAEALMKQGRLSGDWVCLQNCHLSISWLPKMEQDLEAAAEQQIHPEFRLWLTSMPSNKFPVPVLQNGIKITNEPPKGIKANLARTYLDMTEEEFININNEAKLRTYKKLVFGLAFYNAICLERKKYGALGWNIPYSWMNSDL